MTDITECPAHIGAERVRKFHYSTDPVKANDPFGCYLSFRGQPAFWSPELGGYWVLTSHDMVRDAFMDAETFSSVNRGLQYTRWDTAKLIPLEIDAPEHKDYRLLLAPFFNPAAAASQEADIRAICTESVDALVGAGDVDLLEAYCNRVPQRWFLKLLSLPESELPTFQRWEHSLVRYPQVPADAARAQQEMDQYIPRLVGERLSSPIAGDLLSDLARGEVHGRPVTVDEVVNIAKLLFMAGLDTVATTLAFSFHYLATHPAARAELVADPSLAGRAAEELLRFHSFINVVRTVTRDLDFHGIPLKKGDRVLLSSVLAARDQTAYDQADDVILGRHPNRHMGFGAGAHRCLGIHIARVQLRLALEEFHKKIPEYELVSPEATTYHAGGNIGLNELRIRWNR